MMADNHLEAKLGTMPSWAAIVEINYWEALPGSGATKVVRP
jgi:hypothetical protein